MTVPPEPLLDSSALMLGIANGPGLWLADVGVTGPDDITTDWSTLTGWTSLGYASEDGPTVSSSTDSTDIRGWQSLGVLRSVITGRTVTVQFQLLEWNALNLSLYWDIDKPTLAADGSFNFDVRSDQAGQKHQLGVDIKDGANAARLIFPTVTLNAAGDMQFQRGALAVLDVTFSALETNGVLLSVIGEVPSAGSGVVANGGTQSQSAPAQTPAASEPATTP
jgi:hypothetical protein